jgi:hypothetical protein
MSVRNDIRRIRENYDSEDQAALTLNLRAKQVDSTNRIAEALERIAETLEIANRSEIEKVAQANFEAMLESKRGGTSEH